MKTINLTITPNDHNAIQQLAKLGVLRVEGWMQTDQRMQIELHERTWGEWIGELFDPKKAAQARLDAADAFERAINVAGVHRQLAQNIRDKKNQNADITGEALARDFALIGNGKPPAPVRGGAIVVDNQGKRVDFIHARPEKIQCHDAVLRTDTAKRELDRHIRSSQRITVFSRYFNSSEAREFSDQDSRIAASVSETFSVGLAAKYWTCIEDVQLPDTGRGDAQLSAQQMKNLTKRALEGKRGAVVIEPVPDKFNQRHGQVSRGYSNEGLQAQLEAAREATRAADGDLVVSFACEDEAVLNKLRELHLAAESTSTVDTTESAVESDFGINLSNRRLADIPAKEKVKWKLTSDSNLQRMMSGQSPEGQALIEKEEGDGYIQGWMTQDISTPKNDADKYRERKHVQMMWAYRQVLTRATTIVAIAPIEDIPFDEQIVRVQDADGRWHQEGIICCSDDSIALLIDAISEAQEKNPALKVIIACGEYRDRAWLLSRVDRCIRLDGRMDELR